MSCAVADVLVRLRAGVRSQLEVRVAIIGNVDSGKSTMVGVLVSTRNRTGRAGGCAPKSCGLNRAGGRVRTKELLLNSVFKL